MQYEMAGERVPGASRFACSWKARVRARPAALVKERIAHVSDDLAANTSATRPPLRVRNLADA